MRDDNEFISYSSYEKTFWDSMRRKNVDLTMFSRNLSTTTGLPLPLENITEFFKQLREKDFFRRYATVVDISDGRAHIWATDSEEPALFKSAGEGYPVEDLRNQFRKLGVETKKMVTLSRIHEDFVGDESFDIVTYLTGHIARRFAKAEENAFINGNGVKTPIGILDDENGAQTGVTSQSPSAITYDEMISLYFSLDKDYRTGAIWVMNDRTALAVRKLKDEDGNLLWNKDKDTILGKKVIISNYMPDIEAGAKCVAFGDFSFYWIINESDFTIRVLKDTFVMQQMVGYLSSFLLDGKLLRPEAIKVLKVAQSA